jgi:hypothetical protein
VLLQQEQIEPVRNIFISVLAQNAFVKGKGKSSAEQRNMNGGQITEIA